MPSSIAREEARRRRVSRQQVSRWQRDKRTRRIVFGLIVLVLLAILAVPAYGYYREFLAPPSKKITKVNSKTFTMGYYVKRLRMITLQMGSQIDFSTVPFQLVDSIENEELARIGAPRLGITATPEEITGSIRQEIQPETSGDTDADHKKLDAEFDRLYKQYLNTIKLSDKEFRDYVKAQILQSKIREQLGERIPKVAPQVRVQAIVVAAGDDIESVKARLAKGEDFVAVSDAVNGDEELKANKAEMGWVPRGVMGKAFDESVFALELNTVSEPMSLNGGTGFVRVVEKSDAWQINQDNLERLKNNALEDWLLGERKNNKIDRAFDSNKYEWAIQQVVNQQDQPKQQQQP